MPRTWTVTIHVPDALDLPEAGTTVEVPVDEDEPILAAARASGLWLPADCQQGWCTTCAAKLLAGDVDQTFAKRYYDTDAAADFVLPCTARPRSDVTLEVGKMQELLALRADHDQPPGRSKRDG